MMTLEEAIKHCKDVALSCSNKECALEHFQLLKWLQEYSNILDKLGEQESIDPDILIQQRVDALADIVAEQKPADKVEPKFHEGEWVILTAGELSTMLQIVKVDTNKRLYWFNDGSYLPIVDEECLQLWTIQDAKDGDVLATKDAVFIFKHIDNAGLSLCKSYCEVIGNSKLGFGFDFSINNVHPATKEQRDTLEKAMADAGYTFDFEKKELKKIKPAEIGRKFNVGDIVQYITDSTDRREIKEIDTLCNMYHTDSSPIMFEVENEWKVVVNAEDVEQKPAWSEKEKNEMFSDIITAIRAYYKCEREDLIEYFKNTHLLTKQEWSEEDNRILHAIRNALNYEKPRNYLKSRDLEFLEVLDWLKSLRPQNKWKPSEEQMYNLYEAAHYNCAFFDMEILKGLYDDLKQL